MRFLDSFLGKKKDPPQPAKADMKANSDVSGLLKALESNDPDMILAAAVPLGKLKAPVRGHC